MVGGGGHEPEVVTLEGRVTRVLFRDEVSLFTALRLRPARGTDVRAAGELMSAAVGDEFALTGTWERHPRLDPQLEVAFAEKKLPRRWELAEPVPERLREALQVPGAPALPRVP